ncbi:MAG: hypothetical protein EZS28_051019, partial [Streblomastix strix]
MFVFSAINSVDNPSAHRVLRFVWVAVHVINQ